MAFVVLSFTFSGPVQAGDERKFGTNLLTEDASGDSTKAEEVEKLLEKLSAIQKEMGNIGYYTRRTQGSSPGKGSMLWTDKRYHRQ